MEMKNIFLAVIILFSFFGFFYFSVIVHEFMHARDFKDVPKNEDEVANYCFIYVPDTNKSFLNLVYEANAGAYFYNLNQNLTDEAYKGINDLKFRSELKAYAF